MDTIFRDGKNREWKINVTPWEQQQVKKLLDINLYDVVDQTPVSEDDKELTKSTEFIASLEVEDDKLVSILWVLVSDQAMQKEVEEKDFWQSCAGDALDRAFLALLEALSDFFRRPEQRMYLKRLTKLYWSVREAGRKHVESKLDDATAGFDPTKFIEERLSLQGSQE